MVKSKNLIVIRDEEIINRIHFIRGCKVILDKDLALMYNVSTGNFNKAVKRNLKRFPRDFMFRLTPNEYKNLIFQNGISSWGGTRKMPYVFTEQGIAMLSSILNSSIAIRANIRIIRIFTKLREAALSNKDIVIKIQQLEKSFMKQDNKIKKHGELIQMIFAALKEMINRPRRRIGFRRKDEED